MAESVVRDLIARMASDPEFARNVASNPASSLAGYDLTDAERQSLAKLGADSSAQAQALGERLSKSALFVPTSGAHAEAARQAVAATEVPQQPESAADIGPVHHEFEQVHHLYSHPAGEAPTATPADPGTGFAGINRALAAGRELPPAHLVFDSSAAGAHLTTVTSHAPAGHAAEHAPAAPPVHHAAAAPPVHHSAATPQAAHAPAAAPPAQAANPPPPSYTPPASADAPAPAAPAAEQQAAPAPTAAATASAATAAAAAAAPAPAAPIPPIVVTAPTVPGSGHTPAAPVVDSKLAPVERPGPVPLGYTGPEPVPVHPPAAGHTPTPVPTAPHPHPPPTHIPPWTQNPTGHAAAPTGAPHAPSATPHSSGGGGAATGGAPGKILVTPPKAPGPEDQPPQLTFPEDKNPPRAGTLPRDSDRRHLTA